MAKGFFNTLSPKNSADSAGMKPEIYVEPFAIKVMNEVGIDISHYKPKKLTFEMNDLFDVIVTMGCVDNCPLTSREKTIAWKIEDPKGRFLDKYREVRDMIRIHVEKLILDTIEKI
jgi:arsenate reductase